MAHIIKRGGCDEISNRDANPASGPVCPPGEVALLAILQPVSTTGFLPKVVNSA
jgi:hypothetical protein